MNKKDMNIFNSDCNHNRSSAKGQSHMNQKDLPAYSTEETPFQCQICNKYFPFMHKLREHAKIHLNMHLNFPCEDCNLSFTSDRLLSGHQVLRHGKQIDIDEALKTVSENPRKPAKQKLKKYQIKTNPKPRIKLHCDCCDKIYLGQEDLEKHLHLYSHDNERKIYQCPENRVTQAMKKEKRFPCGICKISFPFRRELRIHFKKVHPNTAFSCTDCDLSFRSRRLLNGHKQTKHGKRIDMNKDEAIKTVRKIAIQSPANCPNDPKVRIIFDSDRGDKDNSQLNKEDIAAGLNSSDYERKNYHCEEHKDTQANKKQFQCHICRKYFSFRYKLLNHSKIHLNTTFPCSDCDLFFSSKRLLNGHNQTRHGKRIDTDESIKTVPKPRKAAKHNLENCQTDPKTAEKINCDRYNQIYLGQEDSAKHLYSRDYERKVYQCQKNRLTHRNENQKLFRCGICKIGFTFRRELRIHSKKVHPNTAFPCTDCDLSFRSSRYLNGHQVTRHGKHIDEAFTAVAEIPPEVIKQGIKDTKASASSKVFSCDRSNETYLGEATHLRSHGDQWKNSSQDSELTLTFAENGHQSIVPEKPVVPVVFDVELCPELLPASIHCNSPTNNNSDRCPVLTEEDIPKFQCTVCCEEIYFSQIPSHMDRHMVEIKEQALEPISRRENAEEIQFYDIDGRDEDTKLPLPAMDQPVSPKFYESIIGNLKDNAYNLRRHTKVHSEYEANNYDTIASACDRTASSKTDKLLKWKCKICSEVFYKLKHLLEHEQRHVFGRQHKCDICNKQFKVQSELTQHRKFHIDSRNYNCNLCKKSFYSKRILLLHHSVHNGTSIKPYRYRN